MNSPNSGRMSKNSTRTRKPSSKTSSTKRYIMSKLNEELSSAYTVFSGYQRLIACSQQNLTFLIYSTNSTEVKQFLLTRLSHYLGLMQVLYSDVTRSLKLLAQYSNELRSNDPTA